MICRVLVLLVCVCVMNAPMSDAATLSMVKGTDPWGSCELASDNGLVMLSVIHWPYSSGASGVRYRVSVCNSTLVWVFDDSRFEGVTGDLGSGFVVNYGACLEGPIVVQTLYFAGSGTSPFNSAVKIMPHPAAQSGQVEATTCTGVVYSHEGGGICIKPGVGCYCNLLGPPYHEIPCAEPVPVESTSWGKVKALYR